MKKTLLAALAVLAIVVPSVATTQEANAVVRCKTTTSTATKYSLLRFKLYDFTTSVNWCYDGAKVTSVSKPAYTLKNVDVTWAFDRITTNRVTGVGTSTATAHMQAQMKSCMTPWTGCQYLHPWNTLTLRGNGSVGTAAGNQ